MPPENSLTPETPDFSGRSRKIEDTLTPAVEMTQAPTPVKTVPSSPPKPVPTSSPKESAPNPLKQIRTFQGDVAEALGTQKESLYSIHAAERAKMAQLAQLAQMQQSVRVPQFGKLSPEPQIIEAPPVPITAPPQEIPRTVSESSGKKSEVLYLVLGSLVLVTLAIGGSWFSYRHFQTKTAPPTRAVPESRLIAVQEEETLNFASTTRETFFTIVREMSVGVMAEDIRHFELRKGSFEGAPLVTVPEFMMKLESQAPGALVRSLSPIFMLGTLGESRFIIFRITSFENAFPGMLAWESNMASDLGPLFATNESLKSIPPASVFRDVISENKDVRMLSSGTSSEPLLLYSFFDNQMLIVTDSLETLKTVVERLTQELLSR